MALSLSLLYSYIQHHSYPSLVPWHLLHRVTHFPLQYDSTVQYDYSLTTHYARWFTKCE